MQQPRVNLVQHMGASEHNWREDAELDRENIARLAEFLKPLSNPDLKFVQENQSAPSSEATLILPATYSPIAFQFMDACTLGGWMIPGFDWTTWMQSDEGHALFTDPEVMASASLEQISMLLTALIRKERFSDGNLAKAHQSGLLVRILKRVAAFAE